MANPTSILNQPAVLTVPSASPISITLDSQRSYLVIHDGVANDGTTLSTGTIFVAYGSTTPPVDGVEAANVFRLKNARGVSIGPGVAGVSLKAASGDPTVSIIPNGELLTRC